jgi:F-type H+-transporting ATPase subunit b
MLIDWFTVCAQVVNFAVLVWLMKRFLYGPIQDAIAAREKRIADELAGADRQRAEADAASAALVARSATFDRERDALMATARAGAQAEGARLVEAAHAAADVLSAQRHERLVVESDELAESLRRRTLEGVFAIARKTLGDLASTGLEASACDVFVGRVRALEGPARTVFADALTGAGGVAVVRSAFDLPEAQRTSIRASVDQAFGIASTLTFETAPALVCGIELVASGQKISWSVADELSGLESAVASLLSARPAVLATAH